MPRINRQTLLLQPTLKPLRGGARLALAGTLSLLLAAHASGLPQSSTSTKSAFNSITVSDTNQHFAYALVSAKDGSNIMLATSDDVREIESRRAALATDFLWVRQENRRYLITNPATLAQAQALWSPVREISAQIDKLDEEKEGNRMADRQDSPIQILKQKQDAEAKTAERKLRQLILDSIKHGAAIETGT